MKFNSKSGHELRTWILFFVGIALAALFAFRNNPLSPWWTLVIGGFTCTAVIVSAVQTLAGGMTDAARKAVEEQRRRDSVDRGSEEPPTSTLSIALGSRCFNPLRRICRRNTIAI